jgi:CRP/FNR family cyclic AMP-dependent transcriptional regulator
LEVEIVRKLQLGDISLLLTKINSTSIFRYLADPEKRELLNISEVWEYQPGEKIITQGETSSCFYAVISGTVNVTVPNKETGKEIFLSCIGVGEFFGESGIFYDTKRTADVAPVDKAEILRIGRYDFFNFIKKDSAAGVKILMLFVNGLLKKLNDSNKELAFERRTILDQAAIDLFFQNNK